MRYINSGFYYDLLNVRFLEGKRSVRFFAFNSFYMCLQHIRAKTSLQMPAKFNVARSGVISQCLGRNRPSTSSTGGNFVLQKVPV